jgi:starvation-inducible outer membrane lipoprotein
MARTILLAACAIIMSACTTIKINPDDTTTIHHDGGAEAGKDLANQACSRAGGQIAEVISTVNKDAALPPGTGTQVTTFRCKSG